MANQLKFTNFASTTIATATVGTGDLSLAVAAGTGNLFPTLSGGDYFYATLTDSLTAPTKREIVKVTARSTDTFTIVRAQDGTIAQSWVVGNFIALRVTAATFGNTSWINVTGTTNQVNVANSGTEIQLSLPNNVLQQGRIDVKNYGGAVGDGVANDRPAFATADGLAAGGDLYVNPGTYSIASNITISSALWFAPGAVIKPSSGVTVTLSKEYYAEPQQKVFDLSAGGAISIVNKEVSVKHFGALGDGTTDDYSTINAAISATQTSGAGSVLFFPKGIYLHTSVFLITTTPIVLRGGGMSMTAYSPLSEVNATTLKYTGGSTASPQVEFRGLQSPHGLERICLDANSLAEIGLEVDTCFYGYYTQVNLINAIKRGMVVRSTAATGAGCAWNTFDHFAIATNHASGICALWITGDGVTNSHHNTFRNFRINHDSGSTNGIDLGYCDSNTFVGFYINGTSGYAVDVKHAESGGFPNSNHFEHIDAVRGWNQAAASNGWNMIIDYVRQNGAPEPTTNNKPLLVLDQWGRWNCGMFGFAVGAAGGGDVRTPLTASTATLAPNNAQLIVGYQGTSANYLDANTHHFRDGNQANDLTITAAVMAGIKGAAFENATAISFKNSTATLRPVLQLFSDNKVYLDSIDGDFVLRTGAGPTNALAITTGQVATFASRLGVGVSPNAAAMLHVRAETDGNFEVGGAGAGAGIGFNILNDARNAYQIFESSALHFTWFANGNATNKVHIPQAGGLVVGGAALATSATTGFLYIPTCAGTPTGVPATQTGTVAVVYDTTNNKIAVYNGAWKQTAALT